MVPVSVAVLLTPVISASCSAACASALLPGSDGLTFLGAASSTSSSSSAPASDGPFSTGFASPTMVFYWFKFSGNIKFSNMRLKQ